MNENKPAIYVYTEDLENIFLKDILSGIEEEGVLYQVFRKQGSETVKMAHNAAIDSTLGTGIALDKTLAVLHLEKLPLESPLFVIRDKSQFRIIGTNAARAVKGQPFRLA